MDLFFCLLCSFIPVAKRVCKCLAVFIQTNVINSPTIHANGRDPFRRGVSAQT